MNRTLSFIDKIKLSPLWILTLMPLPLLYYISDFLFIFIYIVIGYRRQLVINNLSNAFPEKSMNEIKMIARKFYLYLCDYFVESIYQLNMSTGECNRRYQFVNPELLYDLAMKRKNIVLATTHYGNWEWANNLNNLSPYKILGVYKPLSNKLFDRLFIHIRGKYGSIPVPMKHTLREVTGSIKRNEQFALYLVADQRPGGDDLKYWTRFFNQEAPIITGMEKLARRYNLTVVFLNVRRIRRGYYRITFEILADEPSKYAPFEISERYIRKTEKLVKEKPEYYLWSHNRWKYKAEDFKIKNAM
jgi:KDO2-lipid IV(A) lauroyltransferase